MKSCSKCNTKQSIENFVTDNRRPDKLTIWCKRCRNISHKKWYESNTAKVKERKRLDRIYRKEYYQAPERKKKYRIKYIEKTFGIKYEEYDRMLQEQNALCAICGESESSSTCKYLSVDHCHITGQIRGLLCVSCNRGLGMLRDNPLFVEKALNYLKKSHYANTSAITN